MDRYSTEVQEFNNANPAAAGVILKAMEHVGPRPLQSFWARSDELLARDITAIPMLVDGLFLRTGLAGIVGASDTGKSMFARQCAIDIATGVESFLNYPLNLEHASAIYVASEDSRDATAFLLKKQWRGPTNGNVRCLFAEECDGRISPLIADSLSHEGADLVVIDTWGDLFAFDAKAGASNNDEIAVRRLLAEYSKLATEFGCLVLFVHHTRKGGSREAPHRDHTSGSGAIERKFRCQLHLASVPARAVEGLCPDLNGVDLRALTITKANYLPKDRKEVISLLRWDGKGFRFEDTERTAKLDTFGEYLADNVPKKKEENAFEPPVLKTGIDYSRQELADMCGRKSTDGTFGRWLGGEMNAGRLLRSGRGKYRLPEPPEEPQTPAELWSE
jgi:RecA-family ATPase